MAPERFDGWSDPRSDVYALGADAVRAADAAAGVRRADRVKLIDQVLHEEPDAAASARPPSPARPGDDRPEGDRQGAGPTATRRPVRLAEDLRRFADRPADPGAAVSA